MIVDFLKKTKFVALFAYHAIATAIMPSFYDPQKNSRAIVTQYIQKNHLHLFIKDLQSLIWVESSMKCDLNFFSETRIQNLSSVNLLILQKYHNQFLRDNFRSFLPFMNNEIDTLFLQSRDKATYVGMFCSSYNSSNLVDRIKHHIKPEHLASMSLRSYIYSIQEFCAHSEKKFENNQLYLNALCRRYHFMKKVNPMEMMSALAEPVQDQDLENIFALINIGYYVFSLRIIKRIVKFIYNDNNIHEDSLAFFSGIYHKKNMIKYICKIKNNYIVRFFLWICVLIYWASCRIKDLFFIKNC